MGIIIPRFTDLTDERQKLVLNQLLLELRDKAFNLNMLGSGGRIADGDKVGDFDGVWIVYVSNAVADTEDTVPHKLGRQPQLGMVGLPDKESVIYDGDTTWDASNIYLKASAATTTVNIALF